MYKMSANWIRVPASLITSKEFNYWNYDQYCPEIFEIRQQIAHTLHETLDSYISTRYNDRTLKSFNREKNDESFSYQRISGNQTAKNARDSFSVGAVRTK